MTIGEFGDPVAFAVTDVDELFGDRIEFVDGVFGTTVSVDSIGTDVAVHVLHVDELIEAGDGGRVSDDGNDDGAAIGASGEGGGNGGTESEAVLVFVDVGTVNVNTVDILDVVRRRGGDGVEG